MPTKSRPGAERTEPEPVAERTFGSSKGRGEEEHDSLRLGLSAFGRTKTEREKGEIRKMSHKAAKAKRHPHETQPEHLKARAPYIPSEAVMQVYLAWLTARMKALRTDDPRRAGRHDPQDLPPA